MRWARTAFFECARLDRRQGARLEMGLYVSGEAHPFLLCVMSVRARVDATMGCCCRRKGEITKDTTGRHD
jgi:hypothetical protein